MGLVKCSILSVVTTGAGSALLVRVEESFRPSVVAKRRMKTRRGGGGCERGEEGRWKGREGREDGEGGGS